MVSNNTLWLWNGFSRDPSVLKMGYSVLAIVLGDFPDYHLVSRQVALQPEYLQQRLRGTLRATP